MHVLFNHLVIVKLWWIDHCLYYEMLCKFIWIYCDCTNLPCFLIWL